MIRRIAAAVVIVVVGICLFLTGCQTLSTDKEQQIRKYSRTADINRRLITEDLDSFWLLDRPSNLTQWHVRTAR